MDSDSNIYLRSRNRDNFNISDSDDFTLSLNRNLAGLYEISWINIPNLTYNVRSDNNHVVADINIPPTVTTVDFRLPEGSYTLSHLATVLTSLVPAVKFTEDSSRGSLVLQSDPVAAGTVQFQFQGLSDSAGAVLGFLPDADSPLFDASIENLFPFPVYLGSPLSLDIEIKEASNSGYSTTDGKHGTALVPSLANFGFYSFVSKDVFPQLLYFKQPTKSLKIQVLNPDTDRLAGLKRADWEMMIRPLTSQYKKEKKRKIDYLD